MEKPFASTPIGELINLREYQMILEMRKKGTVQFTHDELQALYIGLIMHENEGLIGFMSYAKNIVTGHETAKEKLEKHLQKIWEENADR